MLGSLKPLQSPLRRLGRARRHIVVAFRMRDCIPSAASYAVHLAVGPVDVAHTQAAVGSASLDWPGSAVSRCADGDMRNLAEDGIARKSPWSRWEGTGS